MKKISYITKKERKKCCKVMNAYVELYKKNNILVLDAGKYGFVKIQYYNPPYIFNDVAAFTDSKKLFFDLWIEWRNAYLFSLANATPLKSMKFEEIYQCLPKETKRKIMYKKLYFMKKAGIKVNKKVFR